MAKMIFEDIFNLKNHLDGTEPEQADNRQVDSGIQELPVAKLIPFEGQPFRPYSTEKLQELAEDIKDNGILSPIIVRPYVGRYQILAGHNRTSAAKLIGLETVPCIVKEVDDNTARLIVVNTNLNQREELLPSEKAFAYKMQMEAMKQQGKRTDLTSDQVDRKLETAEYIAQSNSISGPQVRRFVRLTYLIKPLLDMVDEKQLAFMVGVNLSFLKENEQTRLHEYITVHRKSISLDQSELLKMHSKDGTFGYKALDEVFTKQPAEDKPAKKKKVQISYRKLERYIQPDTPPEQAEEYILTALEFYEKHKEGQAV